jgi:hypothetical protein
MPCGCAKTTQVSSPRCSSTSRTQTVQAGVHVNVGVVPVPTLRDTGPVQGKTELGCVVVSLEHEASASSIEQPAARLPSLQSPKGIFAVPNSWSYPRLPAITVTRWNTGTSQACDGLMAVSPRASVKDRRPVVSNGLTTPGIIGRRPLRLAQRALAPGGRVRGRGDAQVPFSLP